MIESAGSHAVSTETVNDGAVVWHSDPRKDAALRAYAECGTVAGAAREAKVSRQTFYDWMENDRAFAEAVIACRNALADAIEEEAIKRAKEGSDPLIMFLLRAHRPERYREKHVIEVVSPEVQSRLAQQADAILDVRRRDLSRELAAVVASALANRLREVWT